MNVNPLVISTGRTDVSLREYTENDAGTIFRLIDRSREHLSQWGDPTASKYPTEDAVLRSIQRPVRAGRLRMGIWFGNEFTGSINLQSLPAPYYAEIGYWLGKGYVGHGLMTVAVRTMTSYAFCKEEYFYLSANVRQENLRSQAVLERVGFNRIPGGTIYFNYRLRSIDWSETQQ